MFHFHMQGDKSISMLRKSFASFALTIRTDTLPCAPVFRIDYWRIWSRYSRPELAFALLTISLQQSSVYIDISCTTSLRQVGVVTLCLCCLCGLGIFLWTRIKSKISYGPWENDIKWWSVIVIKVEKEKFKINMSRRSCAWSFPSPLVIMHM
jgi:hypothetical protein